MNEYVIAKKEDLTSIADSIREKSEGSTTIDFPSGFVNEILNIEQNKIETKTICVVPNSIPFYFYCLVKGDNGIELYSLKVEESNNIQKEYTIENVISPNIMCMAIEGYGGYDGFDFKGSSKPRTTLYYRSDATKAVAIFYFESMPKRISYLTKK